MLAAQAAAVAAEAVQAERAAALRDIPGPAADVGDIAAFIQRVRSDMQSGAVGSWQADSNLRADALQTMCHQWMVDKPAEQRREIHKFLLEFTEFAFPLTCSRI